MASALDRSNREKEIQKAQRSREKEQSRLAARVAKASKKQNGEGRHRIDRNSSANREIRNTVVTMVYSSMFIVLAFVICEVLLYTQFGNWGKLENHLNNIADNSIAFIVGLSAMDALTYFNTVGRTRRNETRAIIRHNRIIEPSIDMFLARKNMLLTAPGETVDQYRVNTKFDIRNFADMFGPSEIASDAGMSKIDMFEFHQKKLYKAFLNMVEDIDFSFNPGCCEAALDFINATTYGSSALASVQSIGGPGNSANRAALIRMIKEEGTGGDISNTRPELMSVYILMQMIRDQEGALERYMDAVGEIEGEDPDTANLRKHHAF